MVSIGVPTRSDKPQYAGVRRTANGFQNRVRINEYLARRAYVRGDRRYGTDAVISDSTPSSVFQEIPASSGEVPR
jgi:hypothetical protein